MKPTDIEERLKQLPMRDIPDTWRAGILNSARVTEVETQIPAHARWWPEWLWPCPQAWAALSAVWVLILALNMAGERDPQGTIHLAATPAGNATITLTEREELLDQIIGDNFPPAPKPPAHKASLPGPQSRRRATCVTV